MILLLGTTPDDILYIRKKMKLVEKGALKGDHFYYVGEYGGKDICITYTGNSNLMSSIICTYMIRKFDPYLVISIGSCSSASKGLKQGDLFVAERVYLGVFDYNSVNDRHFSEAIHMAPYYVTEDSYIRYVERINVSAGNYKLVRGPVLNVGKFYTDMNEVNKLIDNQENFLGGKIAIDTEMGGIVTCARFFGVPWLMIKAINYEIGEDEQLLTHVRVGVEAQPRIGAIVAQLFNFLNTSLEETL
ncbi:MAG: hypothetical protein WC968_01260 [Bacilli bacterium]